MFSPTRTALCVALCAAMGLAANEVSAGCKIISGTKVCAAWITGSEICQVGIDSNQISLDPNNATAQCIVHGNGGPSGGFDFSCDDLDLTGTQTCGPAPTFTASTTAGTGGNGNGFAGANPARQGPKCDHDKKDKNPACIEGTPNLGGGELDSPIVPLSCDSKGICTATAEVGVPDGATCSNGGALLDFTADEFIGVAVFDGGESPTFGTTLLFQHCTLDNNGHSYTCTDVTDDIDQGSCGFGD